MRGTWLVPQLERVGLAIPMRNNLDRTTPAEEKPCIVAAFTRSRLTLVKEPGPTVTTSWSTQYPPITVTFTDETQLPASTVVSTQPPITTTVTYETTLPPQTRTISTQLPPSTITYVTSVPLGFSPLLFFSPSLTLGRLRTQFHTSRRALSYPPPRPRSQPSPIPPE